MAASISMVNGVPTLGTSTGGVFTPAIQSSSNVAIGLNSGQTGQGPFAIAIGLNAGQTDQKDNSIAIGRQAGETNQNTQAIAIGTNAGNTGQQDDAVAIGVNAALFGQGSSSIAIGAHAGWNATTGTQPANSIVISALGAPNATMQGTTNSIVLATKALNIAPAIADAGGFFVNPVSRKAAVVGTSFALQYNTLTNEIYFVQP